MFALLLGLSLAAEPPVQSPETAEQAQSLIESMEAQQEALQAINVEGLLALIEQTEDQQSPAVVEPSSPIVPPPAETVEDTDISPLLVPVR